MHQDVKVHKGVLCAASCLSAFVARTTHCHPLPARDIALRLNFLSDIIATSTGPQFLERAGNVLASGVFDGERVCFRSRV